MSTRDRRAASGGKPIQTTGLFVIVLLIGFITAGVLFGFGTDLTDRTTVTAGGGECTYTLTIDPRDVDSFADERAANERYTDGTFPCLIWLDAAGTAGFAEGQPVREWADKSTNELTARPTGEAPHWATIDGIRAVRFDGQVDGGLGVELDNDPTVRAESGLTVTMLVFVENRTHRDGGLFAISDDGKEGKTAVDLRQSDVPADQPQADEWWATPGPQFEITTEGQWAILTHTVDADSAELFVDGDSVGHVEGGVDALGGEIRLGSAPSGTAFDGYVAEYFVSNERLSTGQRNLIECAMDAKHDSVVGLGAC